MKAKLIASALLATAPALSLWGCGGGGGGGYGPPSSRPFVSASTQGVAPATALAMLATLNAMDSTNHPPLQGSSPAVSTTGNATAGTVTLDFGNGTIVNNATLRGRVVATYTAAVINGSGSGSASLSIDLDDLEFTTSSAGAVQVSGTALLGNFSFNDTSAAATGSNGLQVTIGGVRYDVEQQAYAWNFDPTGAESIEITEVNTYDDGTLTGVMVDLADIQMTFAGGNRAIVGGTAVGIRSMIVEDYEFEAPNSGTLIIAPPGSIGTFAF